MFVQEVSSLLIVDKLFLTDPGILSKLFIAYDLRVLTKQYFLSNDTRNNNDTSNDDDRSIQKLMSPGCYTGRIERRRGAIMQQHRVVIK